MSTIKNFLEIQVFSFALELGMRPKKDYQFFKGLVGMNRNYWQGVAHLSVEEEKLQFYHPSP